MGTLAVTGNSTFNGNELNVGTLDVFGATDIHNTLTVTGTTQVRALHATNSSVFDSNLTVSKNLVVTGNETVGGTLGVTGATTLAGVTATSIVDSGRFDVYGSTQLHSDLTVNGSATFIGAVSLGSATFSSILDSGTLDVYGATALHNTMTVTGTAQVKALHATNSSVFDSNLTVSRNLNIPTTSSSSVGVVTQNNTSFIHSYGTQNTFAGSGSGNFTLTNDYNTGVGYQALSALTSGFENTGIGRFALNSTTTGCCNAAVGTNALSANTAGTSNSALGRNALIVNTTGTDNTACGFGALFSNTTGINNIAIGSAAGNNLTIGHNNIDIGNAGVAAEGNTIRIGTNGTQLATYIAGINGVNVGASSAVLINASGQLGTSSSSRRYKNDIVDIDQKVAGLADLRPVSFTYKSDASKATNYGLVAEEVEGVYPELVIHNKDGQVETVAYHQLPPLLLAGYQQQSRTLQTLLDRVAELEKQLKNNK